MTTVLANYKSVWRLWAILMVAGIACIATLIASKEKMLSASGQGSPMANLQKIQEPYERILSKFQSNNPSSQPRPNLAGDKDATFIVGQNASDKDPVMRLIRQDVLWMTGQVK